MKHISDLLQYVSNKENETALAPTFYNYCKRFCQDTTHFNGKLM